MLYFQIPVHKCVLKLGAREPFAIDVSVVKISVVVLRLLTTFPYPIALQTHICKAVY